MRLDDMALSIGNGGWLKITEPGGRDWYVRAIDTGDGLALDELYVAGLSPGVLASFPAGPLTTWINHPKVAAAIRRRITMASPDLRRAATYYTSGSGRQDANGRGAHWCAEMLLSQFPLEMRGRDEPDEPDHAGGARAPRPWPEGHVIKGVPRPPMQHGRPRPVERPRDVDAVLKVPESTPYPDDFYRQVMKVRADLLAGTSGRQAVAQDIAEANGVPVSTVYRWFKRARELRREQRLR